MYVSVHCAIVSIADKIIALSSDRKAPIPKCEKCGHRTTKYLHLTRRTNDDDGTLGFQ